MSNQQASTGKSRFQTVLLAAIAGLLAVDVGHRFMGGDAAPQAAGDQVIPVSYQPENDPDMLANPLRQRMQMINQLQSIDRRMTSIESQLKGKLRVEVLNFPAPKAEGKD